MAHICIKLWWTTAPHGLLSMLGTVVRQQKPCAHPYPCIKGKNECDCDYLYSNEPDFTSFLLLIVTNYLLSIRAGTDSVPVF
ncbi:hypothetical protein XELAEV_18030196mg [Xenopus laevis]|uniref:Secreted protein n=1 Tax=Xenopus laevis TaxID=8355 RepID=A0A974HIJ7_XENLA|nr:hypothetical protein XELAEV_18030196mg [Xenopus laevis]